MRSTTPFIIGIDREDVEADDVAKTLQTFDIFSKDRKTALSMLGRVSLSVSGYDDDPRPLWQVPEVRIFFAHLKREIPHMLFFLCPELKASKLWVFLCCELRYQKGVAVIDTESVTAFILEAYMAINMFCESLGIDPAAQELIDLSMRMTDALAKR